MRRMCKSVWPHLMLYRSGGEWVCEAAYCNIVSVGSTAREAYENWYYIYRGP